MINIEKKVQKFGAKASCDVCGLYPNEIYWVRSVASRGVPGKVSHVLTLCKKDVPKEWLKKVG